MAEESEPNYWLVGASRGGTEDKTDELIDEGTWRFWPNPQKPDQYRDKILSMRQGDQIAIKSAYTRKHGLPFENYGQPVSVMAIKAIGEIIDNPGDGRAVHVDWQQRFDPPREWFFYTNRSSVWRLSLDHWMSRSLVSFVFEGTDQEIAAFRAHPYWRDRFGDTESTDSRFGWTGFYQAFATQLLKFKERRNELVAGLRELFEAGQVPNLGYFFDTLYDGNRSFIEDICPFTFMSAFNRGATVENRRTVAAALARLIGLSRPIPEGFDGIPIVNNQRSWFFAGKIDRHPDDIDRLWETFEAALAYADSEHSEASHRQDLVERYDKAIAQKGVGWNLSMGMYWIRPWHFLPLDQNTRRYVTKHFNITLPGSQHYDKLTGEEYLGLLDDLQTYFAEDEYYVKSFPEVSLAAWENVENAGKMSAIDDAGAEGDAVHPDFLAQYSLDSILEEGCFFPRSELERMLQRLGQKKNIVLQGAPGTGKTWLSKKIAHAWIGFRSEANVLPIQFHPTLSYEDFVRGWRPSGDGRLDLVDGPFMEAIGRAREDPESRFVVVIEEINRGNPAQIFGEMLTLMEGDKRSAEHGMRLSHMRQGERSVYVPPNLYVIGTMNIADRSLALVDLALRRRFAFFDLEPQFNDAWFLWVVQQGWFEEERIREIQSRMRALNEVIAADEALGPQFRVGHSYVTPRAGGDRVEARRWFADVVDTEIRPLLEEYWFDRPDKARQQVEKLLEGW